MITRNPNSKIEIFASVDELNKAAAEKLVDIANKSVAARGRFIVSLSGGNTPKSLYALLATRPYVDLMPWQKTFIFWGDERCVPAEDDSNNGHMAMTTLLKKTPIPFYNIFLVPVQLPPAEAAKKYEETLKIFFGIAEPAFDLILLGLGDNGHTASLFPGTEVLNEKTRWVKEVFVEEVNMYRITFTAPFINKARTIFFLVTGDGKANMLQTILTGPYQPEKYPAQLISPENGELVWLVDAKAAVDIQNT